MARTLIILLLPILILSLPNTQNQKTQRNEVVKREAVFSSTNNKVKAKTNRKKGTSQNVGSKRKEKKGKATNKKKENVSRKTGMKTGRKAGRSSGRKTGRRTVQKTGRGGGRQATVNMTTCITNLVLYSRLNEKKASSISKQVKRIKGNDKVQGSKKDKKSDFNATMERLLAALGGDPANPTCDGQPLNSSASSRSTAATLATLRACEADIEEQCGSPMTGNATKLAELEACATLADNFKSAFSACVDASKSLEESCTCVEAISAENVTAMQKCDASKDNSAALKTKKACKAAVGKCKTAEAASVEGIDTCKAQTKCNSATEKLLQEVLYPLNEALKNAAMDDALTSAGLNTGAGADGTLPSSGRIKRSMFKSGDGQGCTDLDAEWVKFNTSATKALAAADGSIDEAAASETTETLNRINNRTTLVDDLKSCASESGRQISVSFTIIRIRIYNYWRIWWRDNVVQSKICTVTTAFNISTTQVSCGSSTATTAAAGTGATTQAGAETSVAAAGATTAAAAATTTVNGATTIAPTTAAGATAAVSKV